VESHPSAKNALGWGTRAERNYSFHKPCNGIHREFGQNTDHFSLKAYPMSKRAMI
jgi:hypothetical protein